MLDLFIGLKRVIKRRMVHIDNSVFRLHWLFTSILLISCSLIVTSRQYVGDPIDCLQTDNIPASVLNTYCWIHSTYTVPAAFDKIVGIEVAHPGIEKARERNYEDALEDDANSKDPSKPKAKFKYDPLAAKAKTAPNRNLFRSSKHRKYYTYYQWVCFALFIQAMLFYLPYYIWKIWEGGLLQAITLGMQLAMLSDEERGRKRNILNDYLYTHLRHHKMYAYKYFFCEFLCFLNVFGQFFLMNWFFEGEFLEYGIKVIRYAKHDQSLTYDPMTYIFPRMTKCTFHSYGSSGDVQRHDALCMLTLNVVNEKIYILIWFWFAALFFLLMFVLLYRMLILVAWKWRSYFLIKRCTLSYFGDLNYICENGNIGDWFLLYMLGSNLDPLLMREVTEEMAARMRKDDQQYQEKMMRERKDEMIEKSRSTSYNPLSGFRKNRPELTDCAQADEHQRNATRPTAPSLSNPYCIDPPAIYPAPEYTSGGYLPNAHCRPSERYTANCTDNCPSNHFVTANRAPTIRAEKTATQPSLKNDHRIHSNRFNPRPSTTISHSYHQQSAADVEQLAISERSGCRQSCCNSQTIGENDEDYMDDNQETLAANHCLKAADDECMDRHCALRHSSISNQSISKAELITRQEEMQAGCQSTVVSNQRRCITRAASHCSNSGKLSNARQLSNASDSSNASNLTNSTAQSTGHASSLHPLDSKRTSGFSTRRSLPCSSTAGCANDCCLPTSRSQEHSELCSLASSDYECKLDSECSGNELNRLIKCDHSQSSLPNRTSGYQSNVCSNNSNNSDTLDQVSSLEQTSLDKASLEKNSLGRGSSNKALRHESPVDRSVVDMSAVDNPLADGLSADRSLVGRSLSNRPADKLLERPAGDWARSNKAHSDSLNSGQPSSAKSLLLTSSRRRLGDALSTLIPFNRTRSERGSVESPTTSTNGSSKAGRGNKSGNKVSAERTDLSSPADGRHDAADSHFGSSKTSGPNCNWPAESQPNSKKSKHRKAKRTESRSTSRADENVDLARDHNAGTNAWQANGLDSRVDSPSLDGHRNASRLFQIKKYLKSKPKRHSNPISHHYASNQQMIETENDDDAHSATGYLRQPSGRSSMMHHPTHSTDQLAGLPALKSAEQAKKHRNSLDKN